PESAVMTINTPAPGASPACRPAVQRPTIDAARKGLVPGDGESDNGEDDGDDDGHGKQHNLAAGRPHAPRTVSLTACPAGECTELRSARGAVGGLGLTLRHGHDFSP